MCGSRVELGRLVDEAGIADRHRLMRGLVNERSERRRRVRQVPGEVSPVVRVTGYLDRRSPTTPRP